MDLTSTATTIFTTNGISPQIGILLLIALCSILMSMQDWPNIHKIAIALRK